MQYKTQEMANLKPRMVNEKQWDTLLVLIQAIQY